MSTDMGMFELKSGRWRWHLSEFANGEQMELIDSGRPANMMVVPLPCSWRQLSGSQLRDLARVPDLRLWVDETGLMWRVSVIGPGTRINYPVHGRHLLFDSDRAGRAIVPFPEPHQLGDLTNVQLSTFRKQARQLT